MMRRGELSDSRVRDVDALDVASWVRRLGSCCAEASRCAILSRRPSSGQKGARAWLTQLHGSFSSAVPWRG